MKSKIASIASLLSTSRMQASFSTLRYIRWFAALGAAMVLTACGGGSKTSDTSCSTASSFSVYISWNINGIVYPGQRISGKIGVPLVATPVITGIPSSCQGKETYTKGSSTFPAGLSLNPFTGVVSGTPTDMGGPSFITLTVPGYSSITVLQSFDIRDTLVSTMAGSGTSGFANGAGTVASFSGPQGVAVDSSGNVYAADLGNQAIRKITSSGVVSTLAGTGAQGFANGPGTSASFSNPTGAAVDSAGNVYIADTGNHAIRKITSTGVVSTLAGTGISGFVNDSGTAASFNNPNGVAVDGMGTVYVADTGNHVIRKITSSGVVSTLAGNGVAGFLNGAGSAAMFNAPRGVAVDSAGNVYVGDTQNNAVRKITSSGMVSTLAGSSTSGFANGTGTAATFNAPRGVAVDIAGSVYVADLGNQAIRKITASGLVTTHAGMINSGFINGAGAQARFNAPNAVAVNSAGTVYVGDTQNNVIRKIAP